MFGIGPTEFIIIGVVALMLFSPRELPKILRSAAKFWASLRNTADEFRDAIMNEEEMQDIRGALKGGLSDIKRAEAAARRELMRARMEMQKAQNKLLKTVKAAEESKREELAAATTQPAADEAVVEPGNDGPQASTGESSPTAPTLAADAPGGAVSRAATEAAESFAATVAAASTPAPIDPPAPAPAGAVPAARPGRPPDVGQGAA